MDRRGDRAGSGDRSGDTGRRMQSRWSSDGPTDDHFPRGGGRFHRGDRFHPYRGPQDHPTGDGGPGFRGGHGGFGHQVPMGDGNGGPKRGFFGPGGSPDYADGKKLAKLFIGSVPKTTTEEDIRPLFEVHGNVVEVAVIMDKKSGYQQGFCFVKYATTEEADRAIAALHNKYTLPGASAPLQVRYATGDRDRHGAAEDKLFVASMNRRATEEEIAEIFSPYGHVEDVYLMRDEFRQSRGCGFVKFSNRDMAIAAINALHENYVMRGCEQPLIVRFADPKRPRLDSRGGPAFGGPGFGHQSETSINRPLSNVDEPMGGRPPPNEWGPANQLPSGPSFPARTHGFDTNFSTKDGAAETSSLTAGPLGDTGGPASGPHSSLAATPLSQQGFNMTQVNPVAGQQMPLLQKPFIAPQHLPPSLQQPNNQQILASHSQGQALQAPMQQLGQLQVPSGQNVPSQQLPGLGGQLSAPQPSIQPNASAGGLHTPLGLQQQGVAAVANQQQLPQFLQRPVQQLAPSQYPQVLLQQQAQALQSSFQSSQQALSQLQQQVQSMQQSGPNQPQLSQNPNQLPTWSGPLTTSSSTPVSMPAAVMLSAASSVPASATSALPLSCDWSEHNSPDGFKYYYNCVTRESRWEKPEEFLIFEQQQKLLLLQQQQQKLAAQPLQSPVQTILQSQVQPIQHVSQAQPAQFQPLQPSAYQVPGLAGYQGIQGFNNAVVPAVGSVTDTARLQQHSMQGQGVRAAQELSYPNKSAGS